MKKNKKEIEIKLLYKNKKEIISKLGSNMTFRKSGGVRDTYYSRESYDMKNINILTRIRGAENNGAELTYKGKTKNENNVWRRVELTTKISSPKIMNKILINLGFNKISKYKSKRECWEFNGLKIVFVNFTRPAPLKFMEIEGSSEKEIRNTIKKLGNNVKEVGEEIFEIFDKKRKKEYNKNQYTKYAQ